MPILMCFHILKQASGKERVFYFAWRSFIGLFLIFLRHLFYSLPALRWSASYVTRYKRFCLLLDCSLYLFSHHSAHSNLFGFSSLFHFGFFDYEQKERTAMLKPVQTIAPLLHFQLKLWKYGGDARAWRMEGYGWAGELWSDWPSVQRKKGSKEWYCGVWCVLFERDEEHGQNSKRCDEAGNT